MEGYLFRLAMGAATKPLIPSYQLTQIKINQISEPKESVVDVRSPDDDEQAQLGHRHQAGVVLQLPAEVRQNVARDDRRRDAVENVDEVVGVQTTAVDGGVHGFASDQKNLHIIDQVYYPSRSESSEARFT